MYFAEEMSSKGISSNRTQVVAMSNNIRENLYTVDLICHGSPSPKILKLALYEKGIDILQLKEIRFRNKTNFGLSSRDEGGEYKTIVKQLYFICNYYRLARNEIVHCGTGRVELRQAKTELNNLTDDLAVSNIRGHLNAPNDFTNLNFDDQVLFSRAARTICDRIYKDSKYDWDAVLENYRTKINSFILSNDSEGKKKARILNFLSQIYPINVNDSRLIESISHFVV